MTAAQRLAGVLCAAAALPGAAAAEEPAPRTGKIRVFIGTYTDGKSKGIYRFLFDTDSGDLTGGELAAETINPSFLAIHPNHRFLYAVNEIGNFAGKHTGSVTAFAIDPATGELKTINSESSGGDSPCHVIVDRAGTHALVANYGGGNAGVLAIDADGRLGALTSFVQHKGSSVNHERQEGPHAHSINLDPANRFAVVADLGIDKLMVYKYDSAKGILSPADPAFVATAAGAGPRHYAFHPAAPFAYAINELNCTVLPLAYDPAHGRLQPLQAVPTLPVAYKPEYSTAEVQVHPGGRFVYGSNRGHDSITIFTVDAATGALKPVGHQATGIKTPRNFGIDPTGKFLVVANQDSDSLVVFRIDPETGALAPTGQKASVPMPVCVKFLPAAR